MKIGRRRVVVNVHMSAKIRASRSSRLFAVHNRTFRDGRTHARTARQDTPFNAVRTVKQLINSRTDRWLVGSYVWTATYRDRTNNRTYKSNDLQRIL